MSPRAPTYRTTRASRMPWESRYTPGKAEFNSPRRFLVDGEECVALIDLGAVTLNRYRADASATFHFGCGCTVSVYSADGDYSRAGDHLTNIQPGCHKGHPIQWSGLR